MICTGPRRISAAQRGTSVGAMVAEFLRSVTTDAESDPEGRRRRLFGQVAARNPGFSASERMTGLPQQ